MLPPPSPLLPLPPRSAGVVAELARGGVTPWNASPLSQRSTRRPVRPAAGAGRRPCWRWHASPVPSCLEAHLYQVSAHAPRGCCQQVAVLMRIFIKHVHKHREGAVTNCQHCAYGARHHRTRSKTGPNPHAVATCVTAPNAGMPPCQPISSSESSYQRKPTMSASLPKSSLVMTSPS